MLIALHGKAGAGKTTVSKIWANEFGFQPTSFAKALKESAAIKFGFPTYLAYSQDGKKTVVDPWGITVGEILQREGTEATRGYWGDDFWIKRWAGYAMKLMAMDSDVVVEDVRFDNEAEAVHELGGTVVHIVRPGHVEDGRNPNHASEQPISPHLIDITFMNNGSLSTLETWARTYAQGWAK